MAFLNVVDLTISDEEASLAPSARSSVNSSRHQKASGQTSLVDKEPNSDRHKQARGFPPESPLSARGQPPSSRGALFHHTNSPVIVFSRNGVVSSPGGLNSSTTATSGVADIVIPLGDTVDLTSSVEDLPEQSAASDLKYTESCTSCVEQGFYCDGEQPCGLCAEPGITCKYPHRPSKPHKKHAQQPQPAKVHSVHEEPSHSQVRGIVGTKNTQPAAEPRACDVSTSGAFKPEAVARLDEGATQPATSFRFATDLPNPAGLTIAERQDYSDHEFDATSIVAEIEQVRACLRKHEAEMRAYREYLVQSSLRQAKLDARNAPQPMLNPNIGDPFARFDNQNAVSSRNRDAAGIMQIQIKNYTKAAQMKAWKTVNVPTTHFRSEAIILPKYKSIGRLGPSVLAPNIRTLKYWPYVLEDEGTDPSQAEKYSELQERYQHDDQSLKNQRKCQEKADLWRSTMEGLLEELQINYNDILYYLLHPKPWEPKVDLSDSSLAAWLHERGEQPCQTCEIGVEAGWEAFFGRLPAPNSRNLAMAGLVSFVFHETTKTSIWHAASTARATRDAVAGYETKARSSLLCTICFMHECPIHGAYFEPDEDDPKNTVEVSINDAEPDHNFRQSVTLPFNHKRQNHRCGVFCLPRDVKISDILGLRADGTIQGEYNHAVKQSAAILSDDEFCSTICFWNVKARRRHRISELALDNMAALPKIQSELFQRTLSLYSANKRGPCMIAQTMGDTDVSCTNIFYHMLRTHNATHRQQNQLLSVDMNALEHPLPATSMQGARKMTKAIVSKPVAGYDTSMGAELDERPPFVPCSHTGPCHSSSDGCECAKDRIACEWSCGCDMSCKRRFKGCSCSSSNNKVCFNDSRCECWALNRECDPWLCGSCGVAEVLDSTNKYNERVHQGRCKNCRIQLGLFARTIKAPSEVQGWGLFAGEDLDEHAYIGEYKGEIISNQESDRRGAVYHSLGQEYLFVMNREQQIDASNSGNKMRFMNNSQRDSNINVVSKKMLCNGVQRVMHYAKRKIKTGDELLYDYNYPSSVVKKFWERGERPTNAQGAVVSKTAKGRLAKSSVKVGEDSSQSPIARRTDKKRKRTPRLEEDIIAPAKSDSAVTASVAGQDKEEEPVVAASDEESVYGSDDGEASISPSDQEDEIAESGSESSLDDNNNDREAWRRQGRRVSANDRRLGGQSQKKAWMTRRANRTAVVHQGKRTIG